MENEIKNKCQLKKTNLNCEMIVEVDDFFLVNKKQYLFVTL